MYSRIAFVCDGRMYLPALYSPWFGDALDWAFYRPLYGGSVLCLVGKHSVCNIVADSERLLQCTLTRQMIRASLCICAPIGMLGDSTANTLYLIGRLALGFACGPILI